MEDEDIAPSQMHTADPVCTHGQKVMPVQLYVRTGVYVHGCTGATFCLHRLDQLYVFRLPFCVLVYIQLIILWEVPNQTYTEFLLKILQ